MRGSVRSRGKNAWEITIDEGRDAKGKRIRKFYTVRGKKADAERRLTELLSAQDKGIPLDTGRLTVAQMLDRWYESYVIPHTRQKTSQGYQSIIRIHLEPYLGHIELTKLQPLHIQSMESDILSTGRAPKTVENVHRVISEALEHAMKWGLIWRNPANIVDPPKGEKYEPQLPTTDQALHIMELAKETPHYAAFRLIAFTGCRRGECVGLRWRDLDFDRKVLSIVQSVQRIDGIGLIIEPTKTHRSRRPIVLDEETLSILKEHRVRQLERRLQVGHKWEDNDLVFPNRIGRPLDATTLTRTFKRLAKSVGAYGARLHDLRHFHATLLLKEGVHPKIVQERLGHATISVTLDTYSHVTPGLQAEAAHAFADAMNKAASRRGD